MRVKEMSRKIIISILSIALIGLLLIGGAKILKGEDTVVRTAPEAKDRENILVVYGEGMVSIKPDIAYIDIGVETQDEDAKKAQDINKDTMSKVLAKLQSMGIEENNIKTINYNVDQDIDYSDGKRRLLGYRVYNIIRVTVGDIEEVGEILNAAYNEGANSISGISFDVADRTEVYRQALEKAIEDAKGKAEAMASQVGVKIGKPIGIYEGYQQDIIYGRQGIMKQMADTAMDYDSFVPVEAGEMDIRANVTVEYRY